MLAESSLRACAGGDTAFSSSDACAALSSDPAPSLLWEDTGDALCDAWDSVGVGERSGTKGTGEVATGDWLRVEAVGLLDRGGQKTLPLDGGDAGVAGEGCLLAPKMEARALKPGNARYACANVLTTTLWPCATVAAARLMASALAGVPTVRWSAEEGGRGMPDAGGAGTGSADCRARVSGVTGSVGVL
jgi:hypothetical protein